MKNNMKTLQDILNKFNESKLGKTKETVLSHMVGVQRANEVRLKLYEDRRLEKESDPKFIEEKELRIKEHKEYEKKNGKKLGQTVGKFNMTDYTREMSKVPTMCPNCNTIGPLSNMVQHHMDNCKRTLGYSDSKVIESYLSGKVCSKISIESGISHPQVNVIVRKYKKISS
jgi:hypothetical protein